MTRREFQKLVREAAKALPDEFRSKLKNIIIGVEAGSPDGDLMGLYEGVPLGERGTGYSLCLPDKITVFQRAVEAECGGKKRAIKKELIHLIRHEIAHHFGITDERLEDEGIY
ncbi:MAG: hypothetical protein A3D28_02870 [Omnitrophica bacterium RIFCSPHIGHO2_02_FULL_63_14]|nr:MAG: hypothetical protein A3D28_02870 [Omnitrophica bacterium RIFCSPHIGHO2_02_FULL_63_14]